MEYPWREDPRWTAAHTRARAETQHGRTFSYQSSHDPWFTTSYYLDSAEGVILFDTQYFRSSAEELWKEIQRRTSGRLRLIIITHAHPDHYWGNPFFREVAPAVPILTGAGVMREMRETCVRQAEGIPELFRPDCLSDPAQVVLPDMIFEGTVSLEVGEERLWLWETGPAECLSQVAGWLTGDRALFAGDLLCNRQTVDVALQAVGAWRALLEQLESLAPNYLLTGHLGAATLPLLPEHIDWFDALLEATARHLPDGENPGRIAALSREARLAVAREMRDRFPAWWDAMMFADDETILEWGLGEAATREGTNGGATVYDAPALGLPAAVSQAAGTHA